MAGAFRPARRAARDDLAVYDQQEDPGVIPTDAYAEQAEFAAEVRAIFDAAQQRMQARKNKA